MSLIYLIHKTLERNNMKKGALVMFAAVTAVLLSFSSCDDDENLNLTGINGMPGSMQCDKNGEDYDENIKFYYQGDRLTKLVVKGGMGNIFNFNYEGTELVSFSTSPEDKRVADGNGSTKFKKEGNIITIESSGEPSFDVYIKEMELDENGRPIKITDKGMYLPGPDREKEEDGVYYTEFIYDDSGNLTRMDKFTIADSEMVEYCTFKYDDAPGVMNKMNTPLWFKTYWNYTHSYTTSGYSKMFLNHVNNVTEMFKQNEDGLRWTETYTYTYNKEGFPVSVKYTKSGETLRINY